jgi:hypothetical protein
MFALERADYWSEFISRMVYDFEELVGSEPASVDDVLHELRKRDESITFLEPIRDRVPEIKEAGVNVLLRTMQHDRYYASIQGPWLVCAKSKKLHDAMLFAAQASEVLSDANMMLVPAPAH